MEWQSSGGSSKEDQVSEERTAFVSSMGGKTKDLPLAPVIAVGSKRQRRPSVRLGEIGDLKTGGSKGETLSTVRWISPNYISRKTPSGTGRAGKLQRTRALANVTHQGDGGPVLGIPHEDSNDNIAAPASATDDVSAAQNLEQDGEKAEGAGVPSTSGRGLYSARGGYSRRGKGGQRRRAGSNRSTTNANGGGAALGTRKAKELQDVGFSVSAHTPPPVPRVSVETVSEMPPDFTELSGTQDDIELEDSGAARDDPGSHDRENNDDRQTENTDDDEHTQNGDTEVLGEDDGNRDDSSGRQEEVEPGGSQEMRENQLMVLHDEEADAAHTPASKSVQRVLGTRRMDNMHLGRGASMNGRRKESPGGVTRWLRSLGLEKYSELFEENEVDSEVLHMLTFEDLKEMGVLAVGARRKMFSAIQELGSSSLVGR